jgi:hypothetical protein
MVLESEEHPELVGVVDETHLCLSCGLRYVVVVSEGEGS